MKVFYSTGRRKTATARVFLKPGSGQITINGADPEKFFPYIAKRTSALRPLYSVREENNLDALITVKGGGITGQAEAICHGLARALIEYRADHRPALKKEGFLTRDSRMVERKKPGRHKARKRPQFTKR